MGIFTTSTGRGRQAAAPAEYGLGRLTNSERRVLMLLARGAAPKQAAWELEVAITTVRSHIASAKRKTGARTLQQLVGMFADAGQKQLHR